MKLLILLFILTTFLYAEICSYNYFDSQKIEFSVRDEFGCLFDTREISTYSNENMNLSFVLDKNTLDLLFKYKQNQTFQTFDIIENSAPETGKVRLIVVSNEKMVILHGYTAYIEEEAGITGVDAAFYHVSLYQLFNSFPLKIHLSENEQTSFNGIDGFYYGKVKNYPYKTEEALLSKLKTISFSENDILNSLEAFCRITLNDNKHKNQISFETQTLIEIMSEYPIQQTNITDYNNIAYYLEQAGAYKEAIYLLEKIIEKFPHRTVAYINLGDAYWGDSNKEKAKKAYQTYIQQMKEQGKESRIPKKILERVTE